jgi:predicted alpha-1,2-mannosidase
VATVFIAGCSDDLVVIEFAPLTPILDDVDVFTGTDSLGFGVGSAFPGPALPFGMARPGPDSRGESSTLWSLHCSGYRWTDPYIAGFSSMRLHGTGVPDYGVVALQPAVGWDTPKRTQPEYELLKDFDSEEASPGWYSVELQTSAGPARVELTATLRAAHHRYTLPLNSGPDAGLILDISHVLPETTFEGGELLEASGNGTVWEGEVRFSGAYSGRHGGETAWFVVRFDRAPLSAEVWRPGDLELDGELRLGAFLRFDTSTSSTVEAQVALSFVDLDGARANLDAELPEWNFDATRAQARASWEDALSAFAVTGDDEVARANFGTSAYHSMLMPTLFTDVDGRYRGFDKEIHTTDGWTYYTDFSLWDTYRTLHPLMNLVAPDKQVDFVRSLLTMGDQGDIGRVPQWPLGTGYTNGMVGDPAHIAIADVVLRGIGVDDGRLDPQAVLDQLLQSATLRDRWDQWETKGWLAADQGDGSVAVTLEYAWADAALAELADSIGDPRAEALRTRSRGYRELWDSTTGFLRPRNADGTFVEPFDPLRLGPEYVEGNAWHYTWMAPHDADGLIELFGGPEAFVQKLETFFFETLDEEPFTFPSTHYWHGNEPSIHAAYLFALAGRPDLTRRWSRWVEDTRYFPGPDGLSGNDDAGTLAAWYVLSAAGLYPIAGTPTYIVGAPRFEAVRLGRGEDAVIVRDPLRATLDEAEADSSATINGVTVTGSTVDWEQLRGGAELLFFDTE